MTTTATQQNNSNANEEIVLQYGAFEKRLTLTWPQKDILFREEAGLSSVLVAGPPGTGKTTVLATKGLQWLAEGKEVVVSSVHSGSVSTSRYLYLVLSEAIKTRGKEGWGTVTYTDCELTEPHDVQDAVRTVLGFKSSRPLALLMDYMAPEITDRNQLALDFLKEMRAADPDMDMWISDWFSVVPEGFHVHILTDALRFTPQLFQYIQPPVEGIAVVNRIPQDYLYEIFSSDCNGPDVVHLRHKGAGRDEKWPVDSFQCGQKVAEVLRQIGVGGAETHNKTKQTKPGTSSTHQYRDVLVITRNEIKRQALAPAFARGLEASGIPTHVFGRGDNSSHVEELDDVLLGKENKVTVMTHKTAIGLDSKVVVCLTGAADGESWEITDEEEQQLRADKMTAGTVTLGDATITLSLKMTAEEKKAFREKLSNAHHTELEFFHRLSIWSRCCHQLIVVHLPESVEGPRDFDIQGDGKKCAIL